MKILVVDDDKDAHAHISDALVSLFPGCEIVGVYSASGALKCLETNSFDLITMDGNLGEGDLSFGPLLVRHLRGMGCRTPILMASGDMGTNWIGVRQGANGFISKDDFLHRNTIYIKEALEKAGFQPK